MTNGAELEAKYRNKLMLIASLIIIYSVSGGALPGEFSFLGAKLLFKHPANLELAALIVMLFFWWRHRQCSIEIRNKIKADAYEAMEIPLWLRTKINADGYRDGSVLFEHRDGYSVGVEVEYEEQFGGDTINGYAKWSGLFNIDVWIIYGSRDNSYLPSSRDLNLNEWKCRWAFMWRYWFSYLKNSWRIPDFGDAVLPTIVMMIALTSYLLNKFGKNIFM